MIEPQLSDFPKLECPFVRQRYAVDIQGFKKHGSRLKLREPEVYLVTPEVNPGYEWVFEDSETFAVEKLDGTNVKLKTVKGRLEAVQNRKNVIDPLQLLSGKAFIVEGVLMAATKGWIQSEGEQAGEVLGPKLQANPYQLDYHVWYPFEKSISNLRYKSFDNHARTFENWSHWLRELLFSPLFCAMHKVPHAQCSIKAEGVIFYNLKRKAEGKTYMAKLRRDMFDWYYSDNIAILDAINPAD